mmetsp:Transcript_24585/g.72059  ORF Transcript_24585/g.72059 Transcript_24585/m.72059 type:complete len:266 (-) Transcript_24585:3582-4379(-)
MARRLEVGLTPRAIKVVLMVLYVALKPTWLRKHSSSFLLQAAAAQPRASLSCSSLGHIQDHKPLPRGPSVRHQEPTLPLHPRQRLADLEAADVLPAPSRPRGSVSWAPASEIPSAAAEAPRQNLRRALFRLRCSTSEAWKLMITSQSKFLTISRKVRSSPRFSGGKLSYATTSFFRCFIISAHFRSGTFSRTSGSKVQWASRERSAALPATSETVCFAARWTSLTALRQEPWSLHAPITSCSCFSSFGVMRNRSPLKKAMTSWRM